MCVCMCMYVCVCVCVCVCVEGGGGGARKTEVIYIARLYVTIWNWSLLVEQLLAEQWRCYICMDHTQMYMPEQALNKWLIQCWNYIIDAQW